MLIIYNKLLFSNKKRLRFQMFNYNQVKIPYSANFKKVDLVDVFSHKMTQHKDDNDM